MLRALGITVLFTLAAACGNANGDPHANVTPTPLGNGSRIKDVTDPSSPDHPDAMDPKHLPTVNITGASVLWLDSFDETHDGKSRGTLYVQDVGSADPFSGVGVFSASFLPADLRVAPGDVLDFNGQYEEALNIGSANFGGKVLPQLAKPLATFRYEYRVPDPKVIDPNDLNSYDTGRKWMGMLVTVNDVTIDAFTDDGKGRVAAHITSDHTSNGVGITNELIPIAPFVSNMQPGDYPPNTHFKSVTGIVTWFFSFHIAVRTKDDLVQ